MRESILRSFRAALGAVDPYNAVGRSLCVRPSSLEVRAGASEHISVPLLQDSKVTVVALGKASRQMVRAAEEALGNRMGEGAAIAPHTVDPSSSTTKTAFYAAGHNNLPDQRSIDATNRVLQLLDSLKEDAIVLFLISGGGSALLSAPAGVTLEEKLATIKVLVSHGAAIKQLNAVRHALSSVKGGRLAARLKQKQRAIALIISDVIGDPLEFIASGPTVIPSPNSLSSAQVLAELGIADLLPPSARLAIEREAPIAKANAVDNLIVCSNRVALEAMRTRLEHDGYRTIIVSSRVDGDAALLGSLLAELVSAAQQSSHHLLQAAQQFAARFQGVQIPEFTESRVALIFGGETTVVLPPNPGCGGRNQHALLAAFISLLDSRLQTTQTGNGVDYALLSAGTDGQDGPTDATGAVLCREDIAQADENTLAEARARLVASDSYSFWAKFLDGRCHLKTGPTGTNVMDVQALLFRFPSPS